MIHKWVLLKAGEPIDTTEAENIEFAALNFIIEHDLKESPSELREHILRIDEYESFNPSLVPKNRLKK